MQFSAGDVIGGKFRVERTLGEGGMGIVVCATHLALGQLVALKFMQEHVLRDPEIRSRFMREARAAGRLKSVHAARILDVGTLDDGAPYMVMEYLEGLDLSTLLRKRGRLPAQEAAEYIVQACEALTEAHALGIVHRDLKPANLFLTTGAGGRPLVKVLDFGVSKLIREPAAPGVDLDSTMPGGKPRPGMPIPEDSVVTRVTDLLGSPNYMAPEQLHSARDADQQSDVWSLGVILYRLVSGIVPFSGGTQEELIYQVTRGPIASLRDYVGTLPPGFETIVAKCMERDKSVRFASVAELARALASYTPETATPSLERIALIESAGTGTRVINAPPRGSVPPPGFAGSALLRDHPSSPSSPSTRPPRDAKSSPSARSATPHGASTAGWATGAPPNVAAVPAQKDDRTPAYFMLGVGTVVLTLAAIALWTTFQPKNGTTITPPDPRPIPSATSTVAPRLTATTADPVHGPPPTATPAPSVGAAPSVTATGRATAGGTSIRPRPRPSASATAPSTAAPPPTATGPDIPDTRQ